MLRSRDGTWRAAGLAIALGFAGTANSAPNILLIIGDDMGVETVASYGVGENSPATANLDDLARNGVRYTNFWSQPVCSPTRATIVTGPGVQRGAVSDALVNSTDLFVTIMEMAGIDPEGTIPADVTHDSVSFLATLSDPAASPRDWVYADEFFGGFEGVETAGYAMRNEQYKLVRFNGVEEFYDLQADPYEHHNLLADKLSVEERSAYIALQTELENLRSSR